MALTFAHLTFSSLSNLPLWKKINLVSFALIACQTKRINSFLLHIVQKIKCTVGGSRTCVGTPLIGRGEYGGLYADMGCSVVHSFTVRRKTTALLRLSSTQIYHINAHLGIAVRPLEEQLLTSFLLATDEKLHTFQYYAKCVSQIPTPLRRKRSVVFKIIHRRASNIPL